MQSTSNQHEFNRDPVMIQTYQGHKDSITGLSFHPNMYKN